MWARLKLKYMYWKDKRGIVKKFKNVIYSDQTNR